MPAISRNWLISTVIGAIIFLVYVGHHLALQNSLYRFGVDIIKGIFFVIGFVPCNLDIYDSRF